MNIDAIAGTAPLPLPLDISAPRAAGGDFAGWLQTQLADTNQQLMQADKQLAGLALGETDNLHQVMISLDRAKLQFQLLVQVRNKLLESYQDILRMQV